MTSTNGSDAIRQLQLVLDRAKQAVRTLNASPTPVFLSNFPALTSIELGTFPRFEHTITLRTNTRLMPQKARVIPIAKLDAVQGEVQNMVEKGISEACEKSDWTSTLVPIMKPDGNIRVVTDFTPLNRHIIPTRHPLPNIREVRVLIVSARVF